MFGRRVYASASVPRRMWPALHIQSSAQSNRILPSLAALRPAIARHAIQLSPSCLASTAEGVGEAVPALEPLQLSIGSLFAAVTFPRYSGMGFALPNCMCMPLRTIIWKLHSSAQCFSFLTSRGSALPSAARM
uniref:Uncharacterized protein n=1 Tax=Trypanosoma congolense (strain IL3000) TaxID=1068625 RepID=G0UYX2_TRYCI|nr:conserved hypothetical protein [Trypanosoma congolense IL3000]